MNVDKFLEKIKKRPTPYKGKLTGWHDDILKLRQAGCTYAQIVEYLKLQNVDVTISSVQYFCSKHLSSNSIKKQKTKPELSDEVIEPLETEEKKESSKENTTNEVPVHKKLPDWFDVEGFKSIDDLI